MIETIKKYIQISFLHIALNALKLGDLVDPGKVLYKVVRRRPDLNTHCPLCKSPSRHCSHPWHNDLD